MDKMASDQRLKRADFYKRCAISLLVTYGVVVTCVFYAQWINKIPETLKRVDGVLGFVEIGRQRLTTITSEAQPYVFTCANGVGGTSACLDRKTMADVDGKAASALWYEQSYLPFNVKRKLVVLTVDGNEVLSRDVSEYRNARSKKIDGWLFALMGAVVIILSAGCLKKARRK